MKKIAASLLLIGAVCVLTFARPNPRGAAKTPETPTPKSGTALDHPPSKQSLANRFGALPLSFEPNEGQTGQPVRFLAHGAGYAVLLTGKEAMLSLQEPEAAEESERLLKKMDARTQRRFQSRKFYRLSPRFHRAHKPDIIKIAMAGANSSAEIQALDQLPGKANYFIGNEAEKWRTGIPTYGQVKYLGIYPGIDLVYYGKQGRLEFDFVVSPGADPKAIKLQFDGPGRLSTGKDGGISIRIGDRSLELLPPNIYQMKDGQRTAVTGQFVRNGSSETFGFQVSKYDSSEPLVIDPSLSYSTYLGGTGNDYASGIAVDSQGNSYLAGDTTSTDFPTSNGYSASGNSNGLVFVTKLDPTGTAVLYSTYLGGTGGDWGGALALDSSNNVYIAGTALSSDFPVVNGFQTSLGSPYGNVFVARIDTTQTGTASLVFSTYLGGAGNSANYLGDVGLGIAVDSAGFAYVTGQTASNNFPTTSSALQSSIASGNGNAFLSVVNTTQGGADSLVYSTYLGGASAGFGDYGMSVAVDGSGNAYVTGQTTSAAPTAFPTTSSAYQTTLNSGYGNAFVAVIQTTQSGAQSLLYSTYLGGSSPIVVGDLGSGIAIDPSGKIYVGGDTTSSDFPVTSDAFQTTNSSGGRAFVAKFDPNQTGTDSLVYSTYLGGTNGGEGEVINGLAVDENGNAFAAGSTSSSDFPTSSGAFQTVLKNSSWDAFLTQVNPTGTGLVYSTYFGGSCVNGDLGAAVALDWIGNPYLDGSTCSTDFSTYPSNAYQTSLRGSYNAFIAKFPLSPNPGIMATLSPQPNSSGWNNSAVMVSFTCIPGGAQLSSCPSPVTVSTQSANQTVSGTATDSASNMATATATVSVDTTPPAVSIANPADGAFVSTPYVTVTGTLSDSLSGLAGAVCDNIPATLSSSTFSCTVRLSSPLNTITVTAADIAGNFASTSVNVGIGMAAPMSIEVTPGPASISVGNSQSFTAVDENGMPRPDATWSVSDTNIATLSTDGSGTLKGITAGQVTLTATVQGISGETTVTVISGTFSPGIILWTAPALSGFTTQQIAYAVPTTNGPGLYSVDTDNNGNYLFRAFTSDGRQMWQQAPLPSGDYFYLLMGAVSDNKGGLLINADQLSTYSQIHLLTDLDAATGATRWQYTGSILNYTPIAVRPDGTIGITEVDASGTTFSLSAIDGNSGQKLWSVQLPNSTSIFGWDCSSDTVQESSGGPTIGPIFDASGNAYVLYSQETYSRLYSCEYGSNYFTSSTTGTMYLLKVSPDGTGSTQNLQSFTASNSNLTFPNTCNGSVLIPVSLILAEDGVLGASAPTSYDFCWPSPTSPLDIAAVSSQGVNTYQLPMTEISSQVPFPMVLGDGGVGFVADGGPGDGVNGPSVAAFDVSSGHVLWTYTAGTTDQLSIIQATSGGGVAIDDNQQGVIQFDSNGNSSSPVASLQNASPFNLFDWAGISTGVADMIWNPTGANGIITELPGDPSPWPEPQGNDQAQGSSSFCVAQRCVLVPASNNLTFNRDTLVRGRDITYAVYTLGQTQTLTPQYGSAETSGRTFAISLQETLSPQNKDTNNPDFCQPSKQSPKCFNDQNQWFVDALSEPHNTTISVNQTFDIDRLPVQVFWPVARRYTYWQGTPKATNLGKPGQQATTVGGAYGRVQQLDNDTGFQATPCILTSSPEVGPGCDSRYEH